MNDDEIRRHLSDTLPDHRDGYWDDLRRSLARNQNVSFMVPPTVSPASAPPLPHRRRTPQGPNLPVALGPMRQLAAVAAVAAVVGVAATGVAWQQNLREPRSVTLAGAETTSSATLGDSTSTTTSPVPTSASRPTAVTTPPAVTASPTGAGAPGGGDGPRAPIGVPAPGGDATGSRPTAGGVPQPAGTAFGDVTRPAPDEARAWLAAGGIETTGQPASAVEWLDRHGRNVLLITQAPPSSGRSGVTVRVYVAVRLGTTTRLVDSLTEQVTALARPSVADADTDGVGEATLGWLAPAEQGDAPPVAVVTVLSAGRQYVLRATRTATDGAAPATEATQGAAPTTDAGLPESPSGDAVADPTDDRPGDWPGGWGGGWGAPPPAPQAPAAPLAPVTSAAGDVVGQAAGAAQTAVAPVPGPASDIGPKTVLIRMTVLGTVPAPSAWPRGSYEAAQRTAQALVS